MSSRHQNIVGCLAWIASRDIEQSDRLNEMWWSAEDGLSQIVVAIHLSELVAGYGLDKTDLEPSERVRLGLEKAKAELIEACREEKLTAWGHTASAEDNRDIPATSWIKVRIDEVDGSICKTRATWLGVTFRTNDVRRLWGPSPHLTPIPPKKRPGPPRKWDERIKVIMERHYEQVSNALERDEGPPPSLTAPQVAAWLRSTHGEVSERTVRLAMARIRGNDASASRPTS